MAAAKHAVTEEGSEARTRNFMHTINFTAMLVFTRIALWICSKNMPLIIENAWREPKLK